MIRKNRICS